MNLEHKIPPPVVGLTCAALAWALAAWAPALAWPALPGRTALAGVLALAGVALDVWGLWTFRRQRTTVNPLAPQRASAVVRTGPYRFTRNPMYLGMALLLLAWCAWLAHPLALVAVGLFIGFITRFQIQPEERALREKFGAPYGAYLTQVRRWI